MRYEILKLLKKNSHKLYVVNKAYDGKKIVYDTHSLIIDRTLKAIRQYNYEYDYKIFFSCVYFDKNIRETNLVAQFIVTKLKSNQI